MRAAGADAAPRRVARPAPGFPTSLSSHDHLGPLLGLVAPAERCAHRGRFGHGDGAKIVCLRESLSPAPPSKPGGRRRNVTFVGSAPGDPCLVYSFGINNDFSFDASTHDHGGCEVHSFDPTMTGAIQPPAGVTFHRWGLSAKDHDGIELSARSESIGHANMLSLQTIRRRLGHVGRHVSLLKMDIEAQEWPVFESLLSSGDVGRVGQLLVELHFWSKPCLRKIAEFRDCRRDAAVNRSAGLPALECGSWRAACADAWPTAADVAAWARTMRRVSALGLSAALSAWPNKYGTAEASAGFLEAAGAPRDNSTLYNKFGELIRFPTFWCCYEIVLARHGPT